MRTSSLASTAWVESIGPAASLEDPTGELADDLHFAVGNDVVLVARVQLFGLERLAELMDVAGLVQDKAGEALRRLQSCRSTLAIPASVGTTVRFSARPRSPSRADEGAGDARGPRKSRAESSGGLEDDEGGPGFVDEDRVHLAYDP